MVELTVDYDGEDEQNLNQHAEINNKYDKIKETLDKDYQSIGAENIKIHRNKSSDNLCNYVERSHEEICEAVIRMTPGKLKRGYYKVLNKLGMFDPYDIIQDRIDTAEGLIKKLNEKQSEYQDKISKKDTEAKEIYERLNSAIKTMESLEAKRQEASTPHEAIQVVHSIHLLEGKLDDAFKEAYHLQNQTKRDVDVTDCLKNAKNKYQNMIQELKYMQYDLKKDNIAKLNKLGEAYGKA